MSVKQMAMVWELDLAPNERLVLLAYADHADDDGDRVYPSLGRVAHKTGYSVVQVRRLSRQLVEAGLMELVEKGHGRGRTHRYRLTLEKGIKMEPFSAKGTKLEKTTRQTLLNELLEEHGSVCATCNEEGTKTQGPDGKAWEIDRIVPARRGGKYERSNVQLSCGRCNAGWRRRDQKDDTCNQKGTTQAQKGTNMMIPEPSIEPSENHTLEGASATPDASTADEFVSFLAEELECAYAPLQQGRKARYGKEFKEQLAKGVPRAVLFKAADRIVERWMSDDHRKLTLEQALEDVVNGKPPRHAQKKLTLVKPEDEWKEGYHEHYEDYTTTTAEERRKIARQILTEA